MRRGASVAVVLAVLAGCSGDDGGGAGDGDDNADVTTTTLPASTSSSVSSTTTSTSTTGTPVSSAASRTGRTPEDFTTVRLEITPPDGGPVEPCCVWFADSPAERGRGLMDVEDLGGAAGMLFQFEPRATSEFYMFSTPMPLSIAFFDDRGAFVSAADMDPCLTSTSGSCPTFAAEAPYRYALEVPQGGLDELGVGEGSSLRVAGSEMPSCESP